MTYRKNDRELPIGGYHFPFGANIKGHAMPKKAVKKKVVKTDVSPEKFCQEFVKAAKAGKTIDDLATTLGMTKGNVIARKTNYAKMGVDFSKHKLARVSSKRIDVDALKAIMK